LAGSESDCNEAVDEQPATTRELRPAPPHRRLTCILASALSGLLVYLSFPPADAGVLGFVALVPFFLAIQASVSWREALLFSAITGLSAYLPAMLWLASVAIPGWAGISVYMTLYLLVVGLLCRAARGRFIHAWPVVCAAIWVGLELARARVGPGFPWLFIGYTQHRRLALVQLATITGVYGVSFLVVFFNCGLAQALSIAGGRRKKSHPRHINIPFSLSASVLLLIAAVLWGTSALGRVSHKTGPEVGVIQQNIPRLVSDVTEQTWEDFRLAQRQELETAFALSRSLKGKPVRLLVWPETTVQLALNVSPDLFRENEVRDLLRWLLARLRALGEEMGCYLFIGAQARFSPEKGYVDEVSDVERDQRTANSVMMFSPGGRYMGRYDKIHLVPFGEYIPLVDWLPALRWFTPLHRSLRRGKRHEVFELPPGGGGDRPVRFSALICYEDVVPSLVRKFRQKGASFLINVTDEGWYHIPGELAQHLAMAVFRAVENRVTVVRAANTGISCFIGPSGEIYALLSGKAGGRQRIRDVRGTLSAPVRLSDEVPFYARHGDVFAWLCLLLTGAWLPFLLLHRIARKRG